MGPRALPRERLVPSSGGSGGVQWGLSTRLVPVLQLQHARKVSRAGLLLRAGPAGPGRPPAAGHPLLCCGGLRQVQGGRIFYVLWQRGRIFFMYFGKEGGSFMYFGAETRSARS